MANLLLALDPNPDRLRSYMESVERIIAPFQGLVVGNARGPNCAAVWAVAPSAPLSVASSKGSLSIVIGEAIDESGRRQSAERIESSWKESPTTVWDGLYFAASVDSQGGIVAGVDLMGLFPLYYWIDSGVVLVATSPEFFLKHPLFDSKLDHEGLVGILLVNGLVGGRTLLEGVRRLQPGNHLSVERLQGREIEAFRIPDRLELAHLPLEGHVLAVETALVEATRRHAPPGPRYGLLLSGGLDSRMVGGLLVSSGIKPRAFTIGKDQDLEMRCAKAAARALGLDQNSGEPLAADYPGYAQVHSDYEHLANGFNTIRDWWTQSRVAELGDRVATGIIADALVGGTTIHWAYTASPPRMSFDGFWKNMAPMGFAPEAARRLLASPYRGLVDSTMEKLRDEYHGYGELGSYQAWRFDLAHGERFHVGATAWRLAFGAWPTIPVLDRQVIKVASTIPASSLAHRATQLGFVKNYLPQLGRTPLDRSDLLEHRAQFIAPTLRDLGEEHARQFLGRIKRRLFKKETRYWYRVNDFNSEAWRTVRRNAEPHRDLVSQVFDRSSLDAILPGPEGGHTSTPESARKLLVGFMTWSSKHL
ncbi:MAG TPA: asparagine synthase-related protein [Fibrobacteria bacterium]|nr:asparagine synthase-related protein [Fibrobacteria bacterium]